ncbi:hypothetical protein PHYNN_148 [Pantoea phage Phynn]|nr:hypothetical protein PHYNN_148 [Pantoea phage Phynn]
MRYIIEYNEIVMGSEIFSQIKKFKQKLVSIEILTAHDYPVGFRITLSCTPATESGRGNLISAMGANYQGNNVWETPS